MLSSSAAETGMPTFCFCYAAWMCVYVCVFLCTITVLSTFKCQYSIRRDSIPSSKKSQKNIDSDGRCDFHNAFHLRKPTYIDWQQQKQIKNITTRTKHSQSICDSIEWWSQHQNAKNFTKKKLHKNAELLDDRLRLFKYICLVALLSHYDLLHLHVKRLYTHSLFHVHTQKCVHKSGWIHLFHIDLLPTNSFIRGHFWYYTELSVINTDKRTLQLDCNEFTIYCHRINHFIVSFVHIFSLFQSQKEKKSKMPLKQTIQI